MLRRVRVTIACSAVLLAACGSSSSKAHDTTPKRTSTSASGTGSTTSVTTGGGSSSTTTNASGTTPPTRVTAPPNTAPAPNITGTWVGPWNIMEPEPSLGSLYFHLTDRGGALSGTVTATFLPCLRAKQSVSGRVTGGRVTLKTTSTSAPVAWTATLSGTNQMRGEIKVSCSGQPRGTGRFGVFLQP